MGIVKGALVHVSICENLVCSNKSGFRVQNSVVRVHLNDCFEGGDASSGGL